MSLLYPNPFRSCTARSIANEFVPLDVTTFADIQLLFPEGHGGGNAPSVSLRVEAVLHLRQVGEQAAENLDIDPGWQGPDLQPQTPGTTFKASRAPSLACG